MRVNDDLRALSQEFARDPDSLVFLQLGEALRIRGEVEAASRVAQAGLERYPELAEARDLYARILVDSDQPTQAKQVWEGILETQPRFLGAHKGLGFLCFAQGDLDAALDHLESAVAADPTDQGVIQSLRLVREAAEEVYAQPAEPPVFEGLEGADHGLLLIDTQGRPVGGGLRTPSGDDVADEVAAYLTGVSQEADRTARLLELGAWEWVVVEGSEGNLHLTKPTEETCLLVIRDRSVPAGRLSLVAQKANAAARRWLEAQGL
jgi:predicted regulator of Ras-like GTPase activity (Roadblock/LC7/MglB family)/Flp pilus assembly protein TadD